MLPAAPSYTRKGSEALAKEMEAISVSGVSLPDGKLTRWDGFQGTYKEILDLAFEEVKTAANEGKQGWVTQGRKEHIEYEYHPARTAKGNGNRFFRLTGTVKVHPALFTVSLLTPACIGAVDGTVRHLRCLYDFPDGKSRLVTVCAEAGPRPIFYDRDDLSLTTYYREGDVWYQISVSVPDHTPSVKGAVRDHTMYWGYKLVPIKDPESGATWSQLTLISQTEIFGWLPKPIVNRMIAPVLSDYVRNLERYLIELTKRGAPARQLVESYGISIEF